MNIKVADLLAASPPAPEPEEHFPWKPWMQLGDPPEFGRYETREIALARQDAWSHGSEHLIPVDAPILTHEEMLKAGLLPASPDPIPALQPDPPPA